MVPRLCLVLSICAVCGLKSSCLPKSSMGQASQRLFEKAKSKATGEFKPMWAQESQSHTVRPAGHNPEGSSSSWYSKFKALFPIWSAWTG